MKIYSNQYDYYNQVYQLNSLLNTKVSSNEDSTSSQSENETKISTVTRSFMPSEDMDISSLNYNGRMLANSVKMQDSGASEISESMEKIKTDMDSIKTADIDNMSADDIKKTLTQLKSDISSVSNSNQETNSITSADLDNMSEADMKSLLEQVQEQANTMSSQKPMVKPPDMFGKVKEDMDSIKTSDIDNMSVDDVKKTLTQLKTDLESIKSPYGKSNNTTKIDIDSMSEDDMRNMLKKIQEKANSTSDQSKEVESSDAFSQVKTDIDSIKAADIDSMSADDIKKTLTQLKTDVSAISTSDEKSTDITSLDLDTMSEADMKNLLEKIQEQENNRPRMMAFNPNYMDGNQYDTTQNESQNVLE